MINEEPLGAANEKFCGRRDEEIIREALTLNSDNDDYWNCVCALQLRMSEPFLEKLRELFTRPEANERELAADILGQSRVRHKTLVSEATQTLLCGLQQEQTPRVILSICQAFGHLGGGPAVDELLRLENHADSNVRFGVVSGLSGLQDSRALSSLVRLSSDADFDVRNWATFEIGAISDMDTPEIREALVARLSDDEEIRGEAMSGLAKRGDARMIPAFLRELAELRELPESGRSLVFETSEAVLKAAEQGGSEWPPLVEKIHGLGLVDKQTAPHIEK